MSDVSSKPPRILPSRRLPPYRYQPGLMPHPIRDVDGHMYGQPESEPDDDHLLWSIDLFNEGYYWETHEAFELLWKMLPNNSLYKLFLQSIILSAAASLKSIMGQEAPSIRLHAKARQKILEVLETGIELVTIIDVSATGANILRAAESGETPYVIAKSKTP